MATATEHMAEDAAGFLKIEPLTKGISTNIIPADNNG